EQVDRLVAPEQVAPAVLEEAAGRQLEHLHGGTAGLVPPEALSALEAPAVPDRRRRRLLHADEQVAMVDAAVIELGDPHPAEEAEGADPALALGEVGVAERHAGLEHHLAADGRGAGGL